MLAQTVCYWRLKKYHTVGGSPLAKSVLLANIEILHRRRSLIDVVCRTTHILFRASCWPMKMPLAAGEEGSCWWAVVHIHAAPIRTGRSQRSNKSTHGLRIHFVDILPAIALDPYVFQRLWGANNSNYEILLSTNIKHVFEFEIGKFKQKRWKRGVAGY